MVGGIVIGISRRDGRTHVTVAECPHQPKHDISECHRQNTCSVYTDERKERDGSSVDIGIGDSLWWQGGSCMWTPKDSPRKKGGVDFDIRLGKIGYSH